jgi:hypothetical protein
MTEDKLAIYYVQTQEQMELSAESKWSITAPIRKLKEENIKLSYFRNEMRLYAKRTKNYELLELMNDVDDRISIR